MDPNQKLYSSLQHDLITHNLYWKFLFFSPFFMIMSAPSIDDFLITLSLLAADFVVAISPIATPPSAES